MTGAMRVGEAVVDLLSRHYGVDTVFGIPGVHNIELYRGLHRSGVRAVSPRHEQGAGFMADGWSIVTGRPGVCCLISGPGLTNALTPIAQAFHDSRPMLVLASTTPTAELGRRCGPLHDLEDQAAVARTVCAFSETVLDPAAVPALIARAWDVFTSARPRPVHLAFPTDVLAMTTEPFLPVAPAIRRPLPDPATIAAAAGVLAEAQRPVIIAGGGAKEAGAGLVAVAEWLDAPVVLTGNAKGVLPSAHPLCVDTSLAYPATQRELEEADAVLVVGSELSDSDIYNGGHPLALAGAVVRIDIDPDQLDRRAAPAIGIVADAGAALAALDTELRQGAGTGGRTDRLGQGGRRALELRTAWRSDQRPDLLPWLDALVTAVPADAVVALDSTQLGYAAHTVLPASQPRSWLAPYGYGTLGCALPMAIGAAVAAPDRPVFALAGDGGWLFTVAEMATAVDEGLDVVLVVWDNRGYAQIRQSFDDAKAPRMGVDVSSHDPAAIARGFGWTAATVSTPPALIDSMTRAFAAGGPQFIRIEVPS